MGARIKILKDGPALVEGIAESPVITVEHEDGTVQEDTKLVAICRCGKSQNQPFCDGSHAKKLEQ